jgi:hypothetical protein
MSFIEVPSYAPMINLPPPVTSGSGLQTFTDVLGDLWVAQNGTAGGAWKRARDVLHARVYRNAAFNCNSGTLTLVPMDGVYRDAWGMSDGSGIAFLVTGAFAVTMQLGFVATVAAQWMMTRAYVGPVGSELLLGAAQNASAIASGTWSASVTFNHVVTNAASHVLTQVTASGTMALSVAAGSPTWCWLSVSYLGTG